MWECDEGPEDWYDEGERRVFTCYPLGRGEPHLACGGERWHCEHGTECSRCDAGCCDSGCPECEGREE